MELAGSLDVLDGVSDISVEEAEEEAEEELLVMCVLL
jgi:hypothetical protein